MDQRLYRSEWLTKISRVIHILQVLLHLLCMYLNFFHNNRTNTNTATLLSTNYNNLLDKDLNLRQHGNDTYKKAISAIRSISQIRKYMSQSNLKRIVNVFVISGINYCNSILYGLPTVEHEKLQRVQNIAARLITGSIRRDHIAPVLKASCYVTHHF